jgi:hypothetical protein
VKRALVVAGVFIASAALGYIGVRGCRDRSCMRERPSGTYAFFEFAPNSGAGMGTVCSCGGISGAKGEPVTFTRASSAYCTKANEWSGIQNGDLVQCSSNQPLVMPGGDGSGALGVLMEDQATNLLLRSAEFDNAAWVNFDAGTGAVPVKGTANTDVAPDGTLTAERVTFASTLADAGNASGLYQAVFMADAGASSLYVKDPATLGLDGGNIDGGGSTGGTFDLAIDKASGVQCSTCTYVANTWTRCRLEWVPTKSAGAMYIGNLSNLCGTIRAAQTPALWGAQAEIGAAGRSPVTSYVPSGAAQGTRASGTLTMPIIIPPSPKSFSMASTMTMSPADTTNSLNGGAVTECITLDPTATTNRYTMLQSVAALESYAITINGASSSVFPAATIALGDNRYVHSFDGVTQTGCLNNTCTTATPTPALFSGPATIMVGQRQSTLTSIGHPDKVLKQICFDPDPLRCR